MLGYPELSILERGPQFGEQRYPGVVRERVVHVAELRGRQHQLLRADTPRQLQELGLLAYYLVQRAQSVDNEYYVLLLQIIVINVYKTRSKSRLLSYIQISKAVSNTTGRHTQTYFYLSLVYFKMNIITIPV